MNSGRVEAVLRSVRGLRPHRLMQTFLRQKSGQIKLSFSHVVELLLVGVMLLALLLVVMVMMLVMSKSRIRSNDGLADNPTLTGESGYRGVKVRDRSTAGRIGRSGRRRLVRRLSSGRRAVALRDVHRKKRSRRSAESMIQVLLPGCFHFESAWDG